MVVLLEPQLAKEVVEVAVDIGMSQRACEQQGAMARTRRLLLAAGTPG